MEVLVVNAGSSSLKLSVVAASGDVAASTELDGWEGDVDVTRISSFLDDAGRVDAVGHRVVHGGTAFRGAVVIDDGVEAGVEALTSLAPLHQPRALAGIRAVRRALPGIPAVACFDTAFHTTLPPEAYTYALPAAWSKRWSLRRYGFHGLSHAYAARHAAGLTGRAPENVRVVTAHLGSGASLCAVVDGRSVDTTMGFTPVEGVVMATRSGSVDPGLIAWLIDQGGLSAGAVADALERSSGLAGMTGGSGDMRAVLAGAEAGRPEETLALDVYLHRLAAEVAAMAAACRGLDVLVFTGGVGEHAPAIRSAVAGRLEFLGVAIEEAGNQAASGDADITAAGAPVITLVITAREDLEIARQVRSLLAPAP